MASGVVSCTTATATARPTSSLASRGNRGVLPPAAAALLVQNHVLDGVVDRARRLPAGQLADRPRLRLPSAELFEALAVGLFVRDELDLRARPGRFDDPSGQLDHRELGLRSDVVE